MSSNPAPNVVEADPGLGDPSTALPAHVADWVSSLPKHAAVALTVLLLDPTGDLVTGRWVLPNGTMIEVERIRTFVPVSSSAIESLIDSLERLVTHSEPDD
ncbi:MAG: hypothetical protein F4Z31_02470 [Gemmatimonadetes bacterium]|nr:hypothetical protein [Gemmatimonadota bacterium]